MITSALGTSCFVMPQITIAESTEMDNPQFEDFYDIGKEIGM